MEFKKVLKEFYWDVVWFYTMSECGQWLTGISITIFFVWVTYVIFELEWEIIVRQVFLGFLALNLLGVGVALEQHVYSHLSSKSYIDNYRP